jgi:hypothetical protein
MGDLTRRSGLMFLAGSVLRGDQVRRGRVAFHYEAVFPPVQARWYRRFRILVTGGILSRAETEKLQRDGAHLLAYEWIAGFYPDATYSAAAKWQQSLIQTKSSLTLNSSPLEGGAAMPGKGAFWYDFGNPELILHRASQLSDAIVSSGYAGIFFDTLGWDHLPRSVQARFRQLYPGLDYEAQQGRFLKKLRELLPPQKILFLNQGYRNAAVYLPFADYDLSESLFTYLNGDSTVFRPWRDKHGKDSVSSILSKNILPASRRFPSVKMVHLNYASANAPTVKRAIRYSYACARLFNHDSYLVCPGSSALEQDDIYFRDLGAPLKSGYSEDSTGNVVWREFRHGVVAINAGRSAAEIPGLKLVLSDPPRGYLFS